MSAGAFSAPKPDALESLRVLIVDDKDVSRATVGGVLRDIGVSQVKAVNGTIAARAYLQANACDVILCEYHFSGPESGQDLLDDIRTRRLVPFSTIFFMITGEAIYERVVSVVENAPDDYLLKPFRPALLEERLKRALQRKTAMQAVWRLIEQNEPELALTRCKLLVRDRGAHWQEAARVGTELCLHLKRYGEARMILEIVLGSKPVAWARLAEARIALLENNAPRARSILEALVAESSAFIEAFDILARVCFEDGDLPRTLEILRRAVAASPSNLLRLQRLGSLAFLIGDPQEAESALARAFRLQAGWRDFDAQTLIQLMLLMLARGQPAKELERYQAALNTLQNQDEDSLRLLVYRKLGEAVKHMAAHEARGAITLIQELSQWLNNPELGFEPALNFLAGASRLAQLGLELPQLAQWTEQIARRFSSTKVAIDLMSSAVGAQPALLEVIQQEHQRLSHLTNDAMARLLKQDADGAIVRLVALAQESFNARFFSLAESVGAKHAERISEASRQLLAQAHTLGRQYCPQGYHLSFARMLESGRGSRVLPFD